MRALIFQTIRKNLIGLLAAIGINAGLLWMMVAFYPSIADQEEEFSKLVENYPEAFLEAFGVETQSIFSTLEGFLSTEIYSLMWPLLLIVLVIALGVSAIAGEVDQGTIEILLAQPLSRTRVYWSKFLSGFCIIVVFVFASNFAAVPFCLLHKVDFQLESYFWISILGTLFGLAIYSLSVMFSSFSSSKGKPAALIAGVLIIMYAVNLIASLKESVEKLKYSSFFYYFDANEALIDHRIDPLTIGVFLGASFICLAVGLFFFIKRDIAV